MMDPNDPRYSDTPNVDTHPLEGRGRTPLRLTDRGEQMVKQLRADGYLLVSEAELAEALRTAIPATMVGVSTDFNRGADAPAEPPSRWYVADDQRLAAAIFAALVKQQETKER